jgi:membrane protein EpsK
LTLNIIATLFNFSVTIVIGIFLTPFLVAHLGPANFGLIPLTTALIAYFGVFSQTIASAINRNLTIAIQRQDRERAQLIYFSSIVGTGVVILILIVPLAFISFHISSLVNMPDGAQTESRILSLAMSGAFLLSIASMPFSCVIFSQNKTYLQALSLALQNCVRFGLTITFVLYIAASIASVGIAIATSVLVSFTFIVLSSFRVAPWLDPTRRTFDRHEFKDLFRLSADIFVMQLGTVALMSSELVSVNLLFGEETGGRYAAVVQLAFMLRNVVVSLASLAAPVIIANYARSDMEGVARSTIRTMKLVAVAVALPSGFLAASASDVLTVWLGAGFANWGDLLSLQAAMLVLSSVVLPVYSVCLAARKYSMPGWVQVLCALLFIGSARISSGLLPGPIWLACLFLGILITKELAYMIPYAARCIGIPSWRFALPVCYSIALFVVSYLCTKALGAVWPARSLFALVCTGFVVTVPYLVMAWFLATSEERAEARILVMQSHLGRRFAFFLPHAK